MITMNNPILSVVNLTVSFARKHPLNALRAVDVRTLTEASSSLGAGTIRTFMKVIVPSISLGLVSGTAGSGLYLRPQTRLLAYGG